MPEQPQDPRNYDMRIPPPHDAHKQHGPDKPASDENESDRNPAGDTSHDDEKPGARSET